jgi:hypothetical protein
VWNVVPASEGTGVTSESDLPCTDRTQTAKGIDAGRPRALVWLMMVRLRDEVEGRLKQCDGAWEGKYYIVMQHRGDPHQLGPAEETTDAHFEEKS